MVSSSEAGDISNWHSRDPNGRQWLSARTKAPVGELHRTMSAQQPSLRGCLPLGMATTMRPPVGQFHTTLNSDTQMPRVQALEYHKPVYAVISGRDRRASQANAVPTARRLLAWAHQTMSSESRCLGRDATVMDMILDHRLLTNVTALPADGRRRFPVLWNYAPSCQAEMEAYWAQQEGMREFVSPGMSKNVEPPVSAEQSTVTRPPNLDGDETWDSTS